MADERTSAIWQMINASRRRREVLRAGVAFAVQRRKRLMKVLLLACLLLSGDSTAAGHRRRSCRRLPRNDGWWDMAWNVYSEERFKKTFRVSRATFLFILLFIRPHLVRETVNEQPISPECRLALCLYRLGRGDYYYTMAEMSGFGVSTISTIVGEVTEAIVSCMWQQCVNSLMPSSRAAFSESVSTMEEMWQFPHAWAAVDGCHIPIKCPPGGREANKEYHNFKKFYSIVLMAMVDAKYRFVWGSCGFPGNSHDAIILQSTSLWDKLKNGCLPNMFKVGDSIDVPPLILGDSAFPLECFLIKPFTQAATSPEERYFNYRLSRARMVVEGAFGQLKGRWRLLLRRSEGNHNKLKMSVLACMVLHNVCLMKSDEIASGLDLTKDPDTQQQKNNESIRDALLMTPSNRSCQFTTKSGSRIRQALMAKIWAERDDF